MILLVTGSRALADTPSAERWATRLLCEALEGPGGPSVVHTGDARGVDALAADLAVERGHHVMVWHSDGRTSLRDIAASRLLGRWKPDDRFDPLARNRVMVAKVASMYARRDVRVLALHAPWSRTRGTAHTVGLARRAGLAVEEHTCPAEHGPRGERG